MKVDEDGAHPLEDPAVRLRHRLGPDVGHAEVIQSGGGEHAGFDVRPDGDDGIAEVGDAELAQMLLYAGANVGAKTRIGAYTPLHLAAS